MVFIDICKNKIKQQKKPQTSKQFYLLINGTQIPGEQDNHIN